MSDFSSNSTKLAMQVSRWSIAVNLMLTLFKLLAGLLANSSAMVSDAVHSASDVFSTVMVMISVKLAGRKADAGHEYGHERLECIASILLAVVLALTGVGIGYSGMEKIMSASYDTLEIPGVLALMAAVVSIAAKEAMYWYTRSAARKIGSTALMADAWHHRSDALSSIGSLLGILGAQLGYPVCDPIASVVICIFILKASIDIFRNAAGQLTDRACSPEIERDMRIEILLQPGVQSVDLLQTRQFASRTYVDVEISANGDLSLTDAHAIAEQVHHVIETKFPAVKHCMVHVNPYTPD